MPSERDKTNRNDPGPYWRDVQPHVKLSWLRLSKTRVFGLVVALACVVGAVTTRHFIKYYSPVPLIVAADHLLFGKRQYYFWFFGFVAKLPYEREIDVIPTIPLDFRQAGRASKSFRDLPSTRLPF